MTPSPDTIPPEVALAEQSPPVALEGDSPRQPAHQHTVDNAPGDRQTNKRVFQSYEDNDAKQEEVQAAEALEAVAAFINSPSQVAESQLAALRKEHAAVAQELARVQARAQAKPRLTATALQEHFPPQLAERERQLAVLRKEQEHQLAVLRNEHAAVAQKLARAQARAQAKPRLTATALQEHPSRVAEQERQLAVLRKDYAALAQEKDLALARAQACREELAELERSFPEEAMDATAYTTDSHAPPAGSRTGPSNGSCQAPQTAPRWRPPRIGRPLGDKWHAAPAGASHIWQRGWGLRHQEYAGEHSLEGDGPPPQERAGHKRAANREAGESAPRSRQCTLNEYITNAISASPGAGAEGEGSQGEGHRIGPRLKTRTEGCAGPGAEGTNRHDWEGARRGAPGSYDHSPPDLCSDSEDEEEFVPTLSDRELSALEARTEALERRRADTCLLEEAQAFLEAELERGGRERELDDPMQWEWNGSAFAGPLPPSVGLRLMLHNCQRKLGNLETFEAYLKYMEDLAVDVAVLQEPFQTAKEDTAGRLRKLGAQRGALVKVIRSKRARPSEGTVLVVRGAYRCTFVPNLSKALVGQGFSEDRATMSVFKAARGAKPRQAMAAPVRRGPHVTRRDSTSTAEMVGLFTAYGYSAAEDQHKTDAMLRTVALAIRTFREKFPFSTVVLAGDLNATLSTYWDTDGVSRLEPAKDRERRASTIEYILRAAGLYDTFRSCHPRQRRFTRDPVTAIGEAQDGEGAATRRTLDYIMCSKEMATHPGLRAGIHLDPAGLPSRSRRSDHLPVLADFPIDCTQVREGVTPVWQHYKDPKPTLRWDDDPTTEARQEFCAGFLEAVKGAEQGENLEGVGAAFLAAVHKAAVGTVAKEEHLEYPKKAMRADQTAAHREGWGFKVDGWVRKLRRARKCLKHPCDTAIKGMVKALRMAAWRWPGEGPEGLEIEDFSGLLAAAAGGQTSRKTALRRVETQLAAIKKYEERVATKERKASIHQKVKDREDLFNNPTGSGQGKALQSLFKVVTEHQSIQWVRDEQGDLESDPTGVARVVRKFFEEWMKSRISVEDRWGSSQDDAGAWENMVNLNTEHMEPDFATMVQEAYTEERESNLEKGSDTWWAQILRTITTEEVRREIKRSPVKSAAGISQIGARGLQMLAESDECTEVIRQMFEAWKCGGQVPDCLNTALMKLLPKTENGLEDLTKVRPIALMEVIVKVFERVLMARVVQVLIDNEVLEKGQYGGLPGLGVQAPLRMLAEMIEDANCSAQELHILVTDLSKAFDTMEYWSQAMSWTCLGMPQHMVNLLVSLDRGSEEGEGATTRVGLAQGRVTDTFRHGRGVRQGSVGGPIKWCVFVNFWIKWVKKKMKGKGYRMSATKIARLDDDGPPELEVAEMVASVFIDDATWTNHKGSDSQEVIRMCETFCRFHGIDLNGDKSELHVINPKGSSRPITWGPTPAHPEGMVAEALTTPVKSLGVWFDMDGSWDTQYKVLRDKLQAMLGKLQHTSASPGLIVHGINTTVVPTIAYPLQVAAVSSTRLYELDTLIRKAFKSAAKVAQSTPSDAFYLPKRDLGWGIRSLVDLGNSMAVRMMMEGLNGLDSETGELSDLAKVIRAGRDRHMRAQKGPIRGGHAPSQPRFLPRLKVGLHSRVAEAAADLGIRIEETKADMRVLHVGYKDLKAARKEEQGPAMEVFTDGSTLGQETGSPTAGWGWASVASRAASEPALAHNVARTHGVRRPPSLQEPNLPVTRSRSVRLMGSQDNFTAESAALLSALRSHHPETDLTIYIDNQPVISRWEKDTRKSSKARMLTPARALWNRLQYMRAAREKAGSKTEVIWVHSHVGGEQVGGTRECACKTTAPRYMGQHRVCEARHRAHIGNDLADEQAKAGAVADLSSESFNPRHGEEDFHVLVLGEVEQGDLKQAIAKITHTNRRTRMSEDSDRPTIAALGKALDATSPAHRERVAKGKIVPNSFPVRAITGTLPTYAREAKRVKSEADAGKMGQYRCRFGDKIGEGWCQLCGCDGARHLETPAHILAECPHGASTRREALRKVATVWASTNTRQQGQAEWSMINPVEVDRDGWETWWGWVGLLPAALDSYASSERTALQEVTNVLGAAGWQMWSDRNEAAKEWEKGQGIPSAFWAENQARRLAREDQGPRHAPPQGGDRPPKRRKPTHLCSAATQEGRRREAEDETLAATMLRMRSESAQVGIPAAARGEPGPTALEPGPRPAPEPEPEPDPPRPPSRRPASSAPTTGKKAKHSSLSKEAKNAARRRDARGEGSGTLDAYMETEGPEQPRCAWLGCGKKGTTTALGCTATPKEPRCRHHGMSSCQANLQPCGCSVRGIAEGKTRTRKGVLKGHDPMGDEEEEEPDPEPKKRARGEEDGPPPPPLERPLYNSEVAEAAEVSERLYSVDIGMEVECDGVSGTLKQMQRTRHNTDAIREPDVMWVDTGGEELVPWLVTEAWSVKNAFNQACQIGTPERESDRDACGPSQNGERPMGCPQQNKEGRQREQRGDDSLPEGCHHSHRVDHEALRCVDSEDGIGRAPADANHSDGREARGNVGRHLGGAGGRTSGHDEEGADVHGGQHGGPRQCVPRQHDARQPQRTNQVEEGCGGGPRDPGAQRGNHTGGQGPRQGRAREEYVEAGSDGVGEGETVDLPLRNLIATGPPSQGDPGGRVRDGLGGGHRGPERGVRQGDINGCRETDPQGGGGQTHPTVSARPAGEVPGCSSPPRRGGSLGSPEERGAPGRTGSDLGQPLLRGRVRGTGDKQGKRGRSRSPRGDAILSGSRRRCERTAGRDNQGEAGRPDSAVLHRATSNQCDEGHAGGEKDTRGGGEGIWLCLGGEEVPQAVSPVAQPCHGGDFPPHTPIVPAVAMRGVQGGRCPHSGDDACFREHSGESQPPGDDGRGGEEPGPTTPGGACRPRHENGMYHGARSQERLELEWVQQILHGAPGEGRATLRCHTLATHEAEGNDGFLFANVGQPGGGSGWPSVVADKFYVLSTPELKRAKITQARLREVAAALDTGGNEGEVPEWKQYEAIEKGQYTDARRRKAKTATERAQLEDEWLPTVECQPCAPVPAGTGRRGARGAGLRAEFFLTDSNS